MAVPPVIAAKATAEAQKRVAAALKNDLFVRRTTEVVNKGTKKNPRLVTVEHELHANPASIGIGVVAGAIGLAVAGWMASMAVKSTGQRITTDHRSMVRVMRLYHGGIVHHPAVTAPGSWTTITTQAVNIKGNIKPGTTTRIWRDGITTPAWDERLPSKAIIYSPRGVRLRTVLPPQEATTDPAYAYLVVTPREASEGWVWRKTLGLTDGTDNIGKWYQVAFELVNPNKRGLGLEALPPKTSSPLITFKFW